MIENPFSDHSPFNKPLQFDFCQHMHAAALHALASQGQGIEDVPQSLNGPLLRQRAQRFGRDSYLFHPAIIEEIFVGMTLDIYRTIEALYCSRLGRGIPIIWTI